MRTTQRKVLLGVGMVAAVAAASGLYFGMRAADQVKNGVSAAAPSSDEPAPAPVAGPSRVHLRLSPQPGIPALPEEDNRVTADEIAELLRDVPSEEDALAARLPVSERLADVERRGIEALIEEHPCKAGYRWLSSGIKGSGALGCARTDGGRTIYEGEVALRHDSRGPRGEKGMTVFERGTFSDGVRVGEFRVYSSSGQLTSIRHYSEDHLSGVVDDFSESGEHLSRTEYQNGNLHGPAIHYLGGRVRRELWGYGEKLDPVTGARQEGQRVLEIAGNSHD